MSELPNGERLFLQIDAYSMVLFNIAGSYYAIEDICSHDNGPLGEGDLEGFEIICPRHGARFCIRTGAALTAPAYEATAVFLVRLEDGAIQVRDDRWD